MEVQALLAPLNDREKVQIFELKFALFIKLVELYITIYKKCIVNII